MMETVGLWTLLRVLWHSGGRPDIFALAKEVGPGKDFCVPWLGIYVVQTPDRAKSVMRAASSLTRVYGAFARAGDLTFGFTALDAHDPVWHMVHTCFKTAMEPDLRRVPLLVRRHIASTFLRRPAGFDLHEALEEFFAVFWSDYLFGRPELASEFADVRRQVAAVMQTRFYDDAWKSVDVFGIMAWLRRTRASDAALAEAKANLAALVAQAAPTSFFGGFIRHLTDEYQRTPSAVDKVTQDVAFELCFIPDFLFNAVHEYAAHYLQQQQQQSGDPVSLPVPIGGVTSQLFDDVISRVFLFPFRGRVVHQAVMTSDDKDAAVLVPAGSTVFVNLLQSGLRHSWGERACLGQAFTRYFHDAFFAALRYVTFTLPSSSTAAAPAALRTSNVPTLSKSVRISSWQLNQTRVWQWMSNYNSHIYKNRAFYDTLALLRDECLARMIFIQLQYAATQLLALAAADDTAPVPVVIVAPEARGLPFAGALADRLALPCVVVRKFGGCKAHDEDVERVSYTKGYGDSDQLEILKSAQLVLENRRVFVVDDGISSGASALACFELVCRLGARREAVCIVSVLKYSQTPVVAADGSFKVFTRSVLAK